MGIRRLCIIGAGFASLVGLGALAIRDGFNSPQPEARAADRTKLVLWHQRWPAIAAPESEPAARPDEAVAAPPDPDEGGLPTTAEVAKAEKAKAEFERLVAEELDRLATAVKLTDQQRPRAAKVLQAVTQLRVLMAPQSGQPGSQERQTQLERQERLALLAVVSRDQEPLLDNYFTQR